MAADDTKALATMTLLLNLILYATVAVIASWAINFAMDETLSTLSTVSPPAKLFPIYFPIGNMATGFFVIFSLLAGVVGAATSLAGIHDVSLWSPGSMFSAAAGSLVSLALTLLAVGLACKEISMGRRMQALRALEGFVIVLGVTQALAVGVIHGGMMEVTS